MLYWDSKVWANSANTMILLSNSRQSARQLASSTASKGMAPLETRRSLANWRAAGEQGICERLCILASGMPTGEPLARNLKKIKKNLKLNFPPSATQSYA